MRLVHVFVAPEIVRLRVDADDHRRPRSLRLRDIRGDSALRRAERRKDLLTPLTIAEKCPSISQPAQRGRVAKVVSGRCSFGCFIELAESLSKWRTVSGLIQPGRDYGGKTTFTRPNRAATPGAGSVTMTLSKKVSTGVTTPPGASSHDGARVELNCAV